MIIDYAVYHDGVRVAHESDVGGFAEIVESMSEDEFIWVGLHEPSQEEFDQITGPLDLHPLAVEDAVKAHQRPKIEAYSHHLFIVLKTLWYTDESDSVDTGEINAFLGKNYLVTVRHGEGQPLSEVRQRAEDKGELLGDGGPVSALYSIVDAVVDQYESVAADLEIDVEEVEASVFSTTRSADSVRIYRLKREVLEFRRAIAPLKEPMSRLLAGRFALVGPEGMPFFRDVVDHLVRVTETIDSVDHLLDNALSAHVAGLSLQQNDDMRKLAAYAAMIAVPTAIAGIYGMNFDYMPELGWPIGYPGAVGLMVVVCFLLFRAFKRSGWL